MKGLYGSGRTPEEQPGGPQAPASAVALGGGEANKVPPSPTSFASLVHMIHAGYPPFIISLTSAGKSSGTQ